MMKRWVFGDGSGEAVLSSQLPSETGKVVTFLDFVQSLAVRVLRVNYQVPLPRIREAMEEAARHGIKYPFAMDHKTFLIGSRVGIEIKDRLIELGGRGSGNLLIKEVVELHRKKLEFGSSGLAVSFTAFSEHDLKVTMNPKIRFGEPLIPTCGYSAQTLWDAVIAEGSIESAAKVYGVTDKEVELACSYFDYLQTPT